MFAIVVAAAIAACLFTQKRYTAYASVVIDDSTPDRMSGANGTSVNPGFMSTQVDVLKSEPVARRAIQALALDKDPSMHDMFIKSTGGGEGDYRSWLAEYFQKNLDVRPSRESNVITITYESTDRKFAADMANAITQAYIGTILDLKVEPAKRYNSFFEARAKTLRADLEAAQARLSEYQQKNGIIVTDERLDVENSRLAELSAQLSALQAVTTESGSRAGQAGANANNMQEVLNNPVVAGLTAELSRQESQLQTLTERLGDRHPQVLQARASMLELRSRLDLEIKRIASSLGVNNTVNQSRLAALKSSIQEQRTKLLQLRSQRDGAAVLVRDVESAQRAYDATLARVTQASMESQNTTTNVSVLRTATVPSAPSSPQTLRTVGIAAAVGLLLACVTVLVRETMDRRLRTPEDVASELKLPLVMQIPVMKLGDAATSSRRVRHLQARVLTGSQRAS